MKTSLAAVFVTLLAVITLPAGIARADDEAPSAEACDPTDGLCDADAGSVQLDDGVIHLDGATNDAAADREAQSGCSSSGAAGSASPWWIPLPFAVALTLASRRRRRR